MENNILEAIAYMYAHGLFYHVSELTKSDGYNGYLLKGDKWSVVKFADVCEKYGFETINSIVRTFWEAEKKAHEEGSDS